MQLTKELLMPAIDEILDCLQITQFMMEEIKVKKNILNDPKYDLLYSVEEVNKLVLAGIPFREAYQMVGKGHLEVGYDGDIVVVDMENKITLICLAGYMKIVSKNFIKKFKC